INLGCVESYDRDTYTCGDSLIEGHLYSELYTDFRFAGSGVTLSRGWIRREDRKVFFRTSPNTPEYPAYDFNVQQGDTAQLMRLITPFGDTTGARSDLLFRVEQVDTVQTDVGPRKRWRLKCLNVSLPEEYWIDGMGSTFGPVERFICGILPNGIGKVQCFWHNGQVEYTLTPSTACNIAFPPACEQVVTTAAPATFDVTLSPNPFTDRVRIEFRENIPEGTQLHLYNLNGREMPLTIHRDLNTISLERGNLPPGMYVLQMKIGGVTGGRMDWKVVVE
ncbi:MAG: T9SS type A sorting domain-containing protein, partial [Lewinellaceae bacterium]|nr:T9SS type A sorting domain-containing protein [Lewinellaceae bacterium]